MKVYLEEKDFFVFCHLILSDTLSALWLANSFQIAQSLGIREKNYIPHPILLTWLSLSVRLMFDDSYW